MNNLFSKIVMLAFVGGILFLPACQDQDRLTLADTQDIIEEAVTDSYFQDLDDMAGVAIGSPNEAEYTGGRVAAPISITIQDQRCNCDGIAITVEPGPNSDFLIPQGVLTIDFGNTGCSDLKGNVRTGKLIFTYNGRRFMPGSTVVTTTDNYTINGVKLEGTRTLTNVAGSTSDAPKFNVVLSNGKATFVADGSVAERESNITWQWTRAANPVDDYLTIEQSSTASGVTRGGRTYAVSLAKALKYKRSCGIAVEGIKIYIIDGTKQITIDYGDGMCDKSIVYTVNGVARDLNI